jgi:hypothetical protein
MNLADLSASTEGSIEILLIGLLITGIVTAVVFFGGQRLYPRYAGPAAFVVLLIGALITLLAAL